MAKLDISIIVPVYKVAPYLRDCLDSVLNQICGDFECICVDDGSPDESGQILDQYAARDSRIRVIHKENGGTWTARNAALEIAKGDVLVFLDGDDVLSIEAIKTIKTSFEKNPSADLIKFDYLSFDDSQNPKWPVVSAGESKTRDITSSVDAEDYRDGFWTRAYRFASIRDIRFRPFKMGQDLAYFTECMERMKTVCVTSACLYGYRLREGSIIHSKWTEAKLHAEIGWNLFRYRVWKKSKKQFARLLWRKTAIDMTEQYAWFYFHADEATQNSIWPEWKSALVEIAGEKVFTPWQNFVLACFQMMPWRATAYVLFYLSHALKRKGFHR